MNVEKIYIFQGDSKNLGITFESLSAIEKVIQNIFSDVIIRRWNHELNPPKQWQPNDLCVFPGGECSTWDAILSDEVQTQILKWIQSGGRLFGVCAGGYFFSRQSELLSAPGKLDIQSRACALFDGVCNGPVFSNGIEVVKVRWEKTKQEGYATVIKGGQFIPDEESSQESYEVLARFVDKSDAIAAIRCKKGNGRAILSSIHWEFNSGDFEPLKGSELEISRKALNCLDASETFRWNCFGDMIADTFDDVPEESE